MHSEDDGPNLESIRKNLALCKTGDWQGKITGLGALELIVSRNKRHATEWLLSEALSFLKPGEDVAVKEAAAQLVAAMINKNPRLVPVFMTASAQIDGNARAQIVRMLDSSAMEKYVMEGLKASKSGARGCCFPPTNPEEAHRAHFASMAIMQMRSAKKRMKPATKNAKPNNGGLPPLAPGTLRN